MVQVKVIYICTAAFLWARAGTGTCSRIYSQKINVNYVSKSVNYAHVIDERYRGGVEYRKRFFEDAYKSRNAEDVSLRGKETYEKKRFMEKNSQRFDRGGNDYDFRAGVCVRNK